MSFGSYVWRDGAFVEREPSAGPFAVADSWRHSRGRTNGLDLHLARFERTAGPLPVSFVDAMLALLDPETELFPRIALVSGLLLFDVRPAPPARETTRLTWVDAPDPRTQPLVKGPDFGSLAEYRQRFMLPGTDDVVICEHGAAAETTTGALVAWDGETLFVPDGVFLPSVTMDQVVARAGALGVSVEKRKLTLDLVARQPLWFLNSLHGVSPVSEVRVGRDVLTPPAHPDSAEWQRWWWGEFRQRAR
ncbi:aminotransferase class IV [Corynebacterium aquatimens]|nr:aminotransferase class IV [Corynebacterium aquatimens]UIZ93375.1 aminotransferase class IV [Corynebacterium sp. CNCTC7651]